jgi:hypothetical protein
MIRLQLMVSAIIAGISRFTIQTGVDIIMNFRSSYLSRHLSFTVRTEILMPPQP